VVWISSLRGCHGSNKKEGKSERSSRLRSRSGPERHRLSAASNGLASRFRAAKIRRQWHLPLLDGACASERVGYLARMKSIGCGNAEEQRLGESAVTQLTGIAAGACLPSRAAWSESVVSRKVNLWVADCIKCATAFLDLIAFGLTTKRLTDRAR
jgi:hypothetical protein